MPLCKIFINLYKNKRCFMDIIIAKMDIRGFLRIPLQSIIDLRLDKMAKQITDENGYTTEVGPYANIEVDPIGKRISITPIREPKTTSFRFISGINTKRSKFIYLKSALNAIGEKIETGTYSLEKDGARYILESKNAPGTKGPWQAISCRNAVSDRTMLSIDSRGTIIFSRKTRDAVNTQQNTQMKVDYNATKKTFKLTFVKNDGDLNVRTIASHANASFMGTLSSLGIKLPQKSFRTECQINGNTITFSVAHLATKKTKELI